MAHANNEISLRATLFLEDRHGGEIVGDALRRMPGVAGVAFRADEGRFDILYDPALASPGQFLNVARESGFPARLH